MLSAKMFILAILLAGVSCRYLENNIPRYYVYEKSNILEDGYGNILFEDPIRESYISNTRVRRQAGGSMTAKSDGTFDLNGKVPLIDNEHNRLSAIGSITGLKPGYSKPGSLGVGLVLDIDHGHALSLQGKHIPSVANQITGSARLNLLNNDNHNLNVNGFITRTMPLSPTFPNFNTKGASLDYTYKNKIGASLGVSKSDLFKTTDYSAMANYNVFRGRDTSLDLNAGFTKSVSPFMPSTGWKPSVGLGLTKYWG